MRALLRDSRPRHCSRANIPVWRPKKSHYCVIEPWGINLKKIYNQNTKFKKMHFKMLSGKWRPFCLSLSVLINSFTPEYHDQIFADDNFRCTFCEKTLCFDSKFAEVCPKSFNSQQVLRGKVNIWSSYPKTDVLDICFIENPTFPGQYSTPPGQNLLTLASRRVLVSLPEVSIGSGEGLYALK